MDRFDLHDRVGFAVLSSELSIVPASRDIRHELAIDVRIASADEFRALFEGQLGMCGQAAETLSCTFAIAITEVASG